MSEVSGFRLRGGRLLLVLLVGAVALLVAGGAVAGLWVEILWQDSVGTLDAFRTRLAWEWGVKGAVAGVTALLVLANLRIVVGTLGGILIRRRFGDLEIQEQLPPGVLLAGATSIALLVGIWFGGSLPAEVGTGALLFVHGPAWGVTDPIHGQDLGFYLFRLPVLSAAISFGLVLTFVLSLLSLVAWGATGGIRVVAGTGPGRIRIDRTPRIHLAALATAFLLLLSARLFLNRYTLLMEGSSAVQGIFGFTDAHARLPAFALLALASIAAAGVILQSAIRGKGTPALVAAVALLVTGIGLGELYPAAVQRLRVEANELERETPFIAHALDLTRIGFGLERVERRSFAALPPTPAVWAEAAQALDRVPLWTVPTLLGTFRQLEARFQYYDFLEVSVGRYPTPEGPVPIALSVREVDPLRIPEGGTGNRASWQNLHLRERFLTGLGAVAAPVNRFTPEGRPVTLLGGIPPEPIRDPSAPDELRLLQSSTFLGLRPSPYAILNAGPDAFLAPDGSPGTPGEHFPEGIAVGSRARKALLAWAFQDWNLLLATEVRSESRLVHRRQVVERARAIAPFLRYPATPYPVIADGRLHWIVDGFTTSQWFPLVSARTLEPRRPVRYVRGSVKVILDAVSGETRLYAVDGDDPILQGWRSAFPGLIRDQAELPAALAAHLRYPRELLSLQAQVLELHHQSEPAVFHSGQDAWARPQEFSEGLTPVSYEPEYGVWRLPGEEEPEFLLSTAFVPAGRDNLAAFLVARSDGERYGELQVYDVPAEDRFPGPRQVEALVEQDPAISQQFSLWRQGGSQVWTGHLHLIPVGTSLLYLEPIFLAAESTSIPELRRVILSDGRRVVMAETLLQAIGALAGGGGEGTQPASAEGGGLRSETGIAGDPSRWPREALALLERAEARLRSGDFAGFGVALQELEAFLRRLDAGAPPP